MIVRKKSSLVLQTKLKLYMCHISSRLIYHTVIPWNKIKRRAEMLSLLHYHYKIKRRAEMLSLLRNHYKIKRRAEILSLLHYHYKIKRRAEMLR